MRPLELYWLKVALAVGGAALVLLVLIMAGLAKHLSDFYHVLEGLVS